jgi:serine/threonine-protein kinase
MPSANWPKVEELYHAALEKPPAERETFLDQACGGDAELRREVQSLLGYEHEAERLMERPAASAATQKLAVVRGTRLGPYEVIDLLGAGGMGEVHRARDTRLGRDVAIKVLPEHVAHDPDALERFGREARAVAALSHPHIAALFDIGETDGTHYLVMELLEGETLAGRLRRGVLPEKDALRIGAEIAEALGAAHGHGIVHRDVKPANVMLTRSGVKLLDFGLARLQRRPGPSGETASMTGLGDGDLAGTLPYMAPEQLEGREADARSDIWALGCVLFEMLTGRRAFDGDSQARLIAAIEKEPAPSLPRPAASLAVERLVRRCLEKDPDDRFQSARDVAFALEETARASEGSGREGTTRRGLRGIRGWVVLVVAVGLVVLLAGALADRLWLRPRERTRAAPVVRSQIDLPPDRPLFGSYRDHPDRTELALSPDGTLLVWAARTGVNAPDFALYQRRMDTGEVTRIPGGERGEQPFFSPNGRWIGFVSSAAGKLKLRKVRVEGGLPVDVADLPWDPIGATWGPNDRIYLGFGGFGTGGLLWAPADGGPPRECTTADPSHEVGHRLPSVLPGGRDLLVTVPAGAFGLKTRIEVASLATGKRKVVVEDGADGRYLPSGHLVFVRQGVLMAAPFDLARRELAAPPVSVIGGVSQALNDSTDSAAAQFTVSDSGLLAYASGGIFPDTPIELLLVDEKGRSQPLPGFDRPLVSPQLSFSPDGRLLAFNEQERTGLLWLFDVERQTDRALSDRGIAGSPRWSPDGERLAVSWSEFGPMQLWIVPAERGDWQRLTASEDMAWSPSWSPDGRFLAFVELGRSGDIYVYGFEDRKAVPFLATQAHERFPEFSPDGRWLAYTSNESGRDEVYVTSFPGREKTLTVSRQGGKDSKWSRDGTRLFYFTPPSPDGPPSMMAVTVRQGPALSLGMPTFLFRLPEGFVINGTHNYELHPDGRHFVIGRFVKTEPPPPITRLELVHNWFADLQRLAPTRR